MKNRFHTFSLLFVFVFGQGTSSEISDTIVSVKGGVAYLPCDITPPSSEEQVYLVLWYKYDEGEPFYSYDTRSSPKLSGRRWSDDRGFGTRALFDVNTHPAILKVEDVRKEEAQIYRCRVDFKSAPTRNTLVNLTVIVPPSTPKIFDGNGDIVESIIGPYEVGSTIVLKCITTGGDPSPEVTWWKDNSLIDSSFEKTFVSTVQNTLTIYRVSEDYLGRTLMCQASNNNVSVPVSSRVVLDLIFRPKSVKIISTREPFSVLKFYDLSCRSRGSRPPATITWWKNNVFLGRAETWNEGNSTYSSITFKPKAKDNGKKITCRADNTKLKHSGIEDTMSLIVYYPPGVKLNFGANLIPEDIAEGNDVYFECDVKANPPAYKVVWKHDGQIVTHDQSKGVIISGHSLVLQEVNRESSGTYSCSASNTEGDTISNDIHLRVMYKPICKGGNAQITGVAPKKKTNVTCNVESHPEPTEFFWSFNNSDKSLELSNKYFFNNSTTSRLVYSPGENEEYGKLSCWARNKLGKMISPCTFHLIPAGPPDPPTNCSVVNQTTESLEVQCIPGFDGGSTQQFLLLVTDIVTDITLANMTSKTPEFLISGLNSGRGLMITIYSSNVNGKSSTPAVIEGFTLKVAQLQVESPGDLSPTLGILVGVVTTILIVAFVVVLIVRSKTKRHARPSACRREEETFKTYNEEPNPDIIPLPQDMVEISVSQNGTSMIVPKDSPPYLPTNRVESPSRRSGTNYGDSNYGTSHPSSWTPLLKSRHAQESIL